jgi:NodT family efflux transporter outer membrane factor (OMF) lipoprotein
MTTKLRPGRASGPAAASLLAGLAAALVLAGCANTSGIEPQAKLRDAASLNLPQAGAQTQERIAAEWWRAFGDEQLNRLVAQALEGNPSLRIAEARLRRAQAVTEVANAATLPQVNGTAEATRQRFNENGLYPPPLAGSIRNIGTLQLGASWELDFFGKHRSALEAALGAARAAQADADAARVLLASNVARSYFQMLRAEEQLGVARRTLAQREEQVKLVRQRLDAGLDTQLELRQSQGAVPEARQQIEALQEQAQLARNALAALIGQPNSAAAPASTALAAIKAVAVPANLPADLLGLRADVAAARWRVEAAGQDVVNAKTQFYPSVNLTAFIGLNSIGLNRLLEAGSEQWGVGPAIHLPIFDAGRLRANLRVKTADLDAAVESYNNTVIDAVHDVADQLASVQSVARQQAEQRDALAAAEGAYDIALQRYSAGLGNYLNVLAAETAVLNQRRLAVDLAARALDTRVGLIRALGGGWTPQDNNTLAAR